MTMSRGSGYNTVTIPLFVQLRTGVPPHACCLHGSFRPHEQIHASDMIEQPILEQAERTRGHAGRRSHEMLEVHGEARVLRLVKGEPPVVKARQPLLLVGEAL